MSRRVGAAHLLKQVAPTFMVGISGEEGRDFDNRR